MKSFVRLGQFMHVLEQVMPG